MPRKESELTKKVRAEHPNAFGKEFAYYYQRAYREAHRDEDRQRARDYYKRHRNLLAEKYQAKKRLAAKNAEPEKNNSDDELAD